MIFPETTPSSPVYYVGDIMSVLLLSTIFITCVLLPDNQRARIILTASRLTAIVYIVRASSLFWTILPGPATHCRVGSQDLPHFETWADILGNISPTHGIMKNCGDLIFSGHTAGSYVWIYSLVQVLPFRCIFKYIL